MRVRTSGIGSRAECVESATKPRTGCRGTRHASSRSAPTIACRERPPPRARRCANEGRTTRDRLRQHRGAQRSSRKPQRIDIERPAHLVPGDRRDRRAPERQEALKRAAIVALRHDLRALDAGAPRQRRRNGREDLDRAMRRSSERAGPCSCAAARNASTEARRGASAASRARCANGGKSAARRSAKSVAAKLS